MQDKITSLVFDKNGNIYSLVLFMLGCFDFACTVIKLYEQVSNDSILTGDK